MIVKQAFVTRENPRETFSIIEKTLTSRPNTQIFVSKEIVKDLPLTNALGGSVYAYNEDFMHWCGYYKEEAKTHQSLALHLLLRNICILLYTIRVNIELNIVITELV